MYTCDFKTHTSAEPIDVKLFLPTQALRTFNTTLPTHSHPRTCYHKVSEQSSEKSRAIDRC
jgi:hypothetical protein